MAIPQGPVRTPPTLEAHLVTFLYNVRVHPLDALGNPVRRKILQNLRDSSLSVHELAARFPVSRPAISRHLRVLSKSGLVETHGSGTRHRYAIRLKGFGPVREFLDEFWDTALARLEELSRK
jgi:DNA-binding transcriptional ArsR family regulator